MNRVLCRAVVRPSAARAIFSAAQSLPAAADFAAQLDVYPFAAGEPTADLRGSVDIKNAPNCLRMSTAAVASRLTQQTECPLLPGTPFTLEGALSVNPLKQPRLVITPGPNPTVIFANEEWEKLCGFSGREIKGKNAMDVLTGPVTEMQTKEKIADAFCCKTRLRVMLINFKKDGMPFMMQLQLSPLLSKDGNVSHVLACVKHI